jgi:hypothetical protein
LEVICIALKRAGSLPGHCTGTHILNCSVSLACAQTSDSPFTPSSHAARWRYSPVSDLTNSADGLRGALREGNTPTASKRWHLTDRYGREPLLSPMPDSDNCSNDFVKAGFRTNGVRDIDFGGVQPLLACSRSLDLSRWNRPTFTLTSGGIWHASSSELAPVRSSQHCLSSERVPTTSTPSPV